MISDGGGAPLPVDVVVSATTGGKKSNRVKIGKGKKKRPARPDPAHPERSDHQPQRALRRFRKDPSTRGLVTTVITISLPVGELAAIDAACERTQMARSHFLRQSAKHFMVKVLVDEAPP